MEARLRDWSALFETLAAEAAGRNTRARIHSAGCAAAFRPRREQAERVLARLRTSGNDWAGVAEELERCLRELERVVVRMQRGFT